VVDALLFTLSSVFGYFRHLRRFRKPCFSF